MFAVTTEAIFWIAAIGGIGIAALVVGGTLLGRRAEAALPTTWLRVLLAVLALLFGLAALALAFVFSMCAFGPWKVH